MPRLSRAFAPLALGALCASAALFGCASPSRDDGSLSPFRVVPSWPDPAAGVVTGQVGGLALDRDDQLWAFGRIARPWSGETVLEANPAATLLHLAAADGHVLATAGAGEYFVPHGLFIAADGHLWVTDVGRHVVVELDASGHALRTLGTNGQAGADAHHFDMPTDVFVDDDGTIFVADGYGNARIVVFDREGTFLRTWGSYGSGPNELDTPHSLTSDGTRILVADRGNARVQVFSKTGDLLESWQSSALGRPWAVARAPNGDLFVLDGGDQPESGPDRARVLRVDAHGNVLETFGAAGRGPGELDWPHDLCVSRAGEVFVGEVHLGARVQKFVRGD